MKRSFDILIGNAVVHLTMSVTSGKTTYTTLDVEASIDGPGGVRVARERTSVAMWQAMKMAVRAEVVRRVALSLLDAELDAELTGGRVESLASFVEDL